jgi:hypothetical protein
MVESEYLYNINSSHYHFFRDLGMGQQKVKIEMSIKMCVLLRIKKMKNALIIV